MATSATPPLVVNCGKPGENRFCSTAARGQSVCHISFRIRGCRCRCTWNSPINNFEANEELVGRISAKRWGKRREQRLQTLHNAADLQEHVGWAQAVEHEGETQLSTAVEQFRLADPYAADSPCAFEAYLENCKWERSRGALAVGDERLKASNVDSQNSGRPDSVGVVEDQNRMFFWREVEANSLELSTCSSHGCYCGSDSTIKVLTGFWTGPEAEDGWGYVNAYVSPAEGSSLSTDVPELLKSYRAFL